MLNTLSVRNIVLIDQLDLAFETTPSNAVRFTIRAGEREVASGVLSAPAPEGVAA